MSADDLCRILGLTPHPEGGFFRETYRSRCEIPPASLPAAYTGPRSAGTAIYYLLKDDAFSAMHRVHGEEMFHFYMGDPVEMLLLYEDGEGEVIVLGTDIHAGMSPQVLVPAGVWQGSRLRSGGSLALLGTTMSPGFEFADFELGRREDLLKSHPAFEDRILGLTQEGMG
jgi:predicted cupin superfamily sugar epimerase